jgi:hypothetical protein
MDIHGERLEFPLIPSAKSIIEYPFFVHVFFHGTGSTNRFQQLRWSRFLCLLDLWLSASRFLIFRGRRIKSSFLFPIIPSTPTPPIRRQFFFPAIYYRCDPAFFHQKFSHVRFFSRGYTHWPTITILDTIPFMSCHELLWLRCWTRGSLFFCWVFLHMWWEGVLKKAVARVESVGTIKKGCGNCIDKCCRETLKVSSEAWGSPHGSV